MMPFCKASIEKFIFDKTNHLVIQRYQDKYSSFSTKFSNNCKRILNILNPVAIFKLLDIERKFWLIHESKTNDQDDLLGQLEDKGYPYRKAFSELSYLPTVNTPTEKLEILMKAHTIMKSCVIDFHRSRVQISSMDEELPLIIFIILHSKIENIFAELNFVNDYVNLDPSLESDKRLMTNYIVSAQYIAIEWTPIKNEE